MSPEALLSILMCVSVRGPGRDPTPHAIGGRGRGSSAGSPPTPSASPRKTISENATL
jgi:hypothetical protein